jgi:hypothetical protein
VFKNILGFPYEANVTSHVSQPLFLPYLLHKEKKTKFKNVFFKKLEYTRTEKPDPHIFVGAVPYYDAAPAQLAPAPMTMAPPK